MIFSKALLAWVVMLLGAMINTGVRERFLSPRLGQTRSHVLGCLTQAGIVLLVTIVFLAAMGPLPAYTLRLIGVFWVLTSILFDFIFGRFVLHHSWSRLLADYNPWQGRLWILVLATQAFAPLIAARWLGQ